MAKCDVCFRHCVIAEGKLGFCGARTCENGKVVILSAGSYGCNLRCPFCQNYEISWSEEARKFAKTADVCTPEDLARAAAYYQNQGNIGIAFTYNEPLIGYEFILDTAMKTVLVTNGTAELNVLEKLAPYIDAMNIDLKGFTDRYYREVLKGDRKMVMDFIARAAQVCHVEVTTLIIPGENDSEEEMDALSSWIAGLTDERGERIGQSIPLHISRFFPRFHMQDRRATEVKLVYRLAEVARRNLTYVYTGNC